MEVDRQSAAAERSSSRPPAGAHACALSVAAEFSGERGGQAPLTWGQRGIWVKQQRDPGSDLDLPYVLPSDSAAITVPRAVAAITQVIERHEMLRTRVQCLDGTLSQVVERSGTLTIPVVRSRAATLDTDTGAALLWLRKARFDSSREFPIRVLLVTVQARVMRVVVVLSHIAADASAAQIIVADLSSAIAGELHLEPPAPQPMDLAREEQHKGRRQSAIWCRSGCSCSTSTRSWPSPTSCGALRAVRSMLTGMRITIRRSSRPCSKESGANEGRTSIRIAVSTMYVICSMIPGAPADRMRSRSQAAPATRSISVKNERARSCRRPHCTGSRTRRHHGAGSVCRCAPAATPFPCR